MAEQLPQETLIGSLLLSVGVVSSTLGSWVKYLYGKNKDKDTQIESLTKAINEQSQAHQETKNELLIAKTTITLQEQTITRQSTEIIAEREQNRRIIGQYADVVKRLGKLEDDYSEQQQIIQQQAQTIKEIKGNVEKLIAENEKLKKEKTTLILERDELESQNETLRGQIETLTQTINENTILISSLQTKVDEISLQNENTDTIGDE